MWEWTASAGLAGQVTRGNGWGGTRGGLPVASTRDYARPATTRLNDIGARCIVNEDPAPAPL